MFFKKCLRGLFITFGLFYLVCTMSLISFTTFIDKRALVEQELSAIAGRKISLKGPFSLTMGWKPIIKFENFSMSNASWSKHPQMISAGSMEIETSLESLFAGIVDIKSVILNEPTVLLERNKKGEGNWVFGDSKDGKGPNAEQMAWVKLVKIRDGELTFLNKSGVPDFNLKVRRLQAKNNVKENSIKLTGDGVFIDRLKVFPRMTRSADTDPKIIPGAFALAATYRADKDRYYLDKIDGHVAGRPVLGSLQVTDQKKSGKLKVEGRMNLEFLNVQAIYDDSELVKSSSPSVSKFFISDYELSLKPLTDVDLDLNLKVATIPIHKLVTVENADGQISLNRGLLKLEKGRGKFAGGTYNLEYELDSKKVPAKYVLKFQADDFQYGEWLAQRNLAQGVQGKGEVMLQMSGEGNNLHTMLSTADGRFSFMSENGQLISKDLEVMALSLDDALPSLFNEDVKSLPLHCLMADYQIKKGIASSSNALVHAGVILAHGEGSIDFTKEEFLMSIHARSDTASLSSFIPPFEVSGSWFKPKIEWDATGSTAEIFDSIGTLLMSPLALVTNVVSAEKAPSKSPCQRAIDANEKDLRNIRENKDVLRETINSIEDAGEYVENGLGEMLEDIGDGLGDIF